MDYTKTPLAESISIRHIISIHYFEHAKDYVYKEEKHDFWEFLYVDKGEIEVIAGTEGFRLKQGEIIFHQPHEVHNVWANGKLAPNIIVIAWECHSEAMAALRRKIFSISDHEKDLLAQLLKEASYVAFPPFHSMGIEKSKDVPFAPQQMLKILLEQFFISLIRRNNQVCLKSRLSSTTKERYNKDLIQKLAAYLRQNLDKQLSFKDLVDYSQISSTHVKLLFKSETGMSAMEYYRRLKIDQAKHMIREESLSLTEIAERLGYLSIHAFSKQFKTIIGMSPSEYAYTVQAKLGR